MWLDYLRTLPQYLIPQYLLTRLLGWLAASHRPWLKNVAIQWFVRFYSVDMSEAVEAQAQQYPSFNAFFTRALKKSARPIASEAGAIVSPADGCLSQIGRIEHNRLIQAKGHHFSLHELLGGQHERTELFTNGTFATLYLSPKDYHRVHMPLTGTLTEMIYVPGRLFAVNNSAAKVIPQLFSRNERVICLFDTAAGPMAVILVGALIVGSIHTVWHGVVTPPHKQALHHWRYPNPKTEAVRLNTGDELGHFQLGSTVIVLFGEQCTAWRDNWNRQQEIKMGEGLGVITNAINHTGIIIGN